MSKNNQVAEATTEQIAKLQAENNDLKDQLSVLQAENADLSAKLTLAASAGPVSGAPSIPEGIFEVGGKKYKPMLAKVRIPGIGEVTAAELLVNEQAQRALVEMGSGAIKHVL